MADSVVHTRPFKICNSERNDKKGIACSTLEELKRISCERFSLSKRCRTFLESDGTEVDNDEYFQFLPSQTLFMVTDFDGQWVSNATESVGSQMKFDDLSESQESYQGEDQVDGLSASLSASLRQKITNDPVFFVSLSTEELQSVVDLETNDLPVELRCSESKANIYRESCQQELDRRMEMKETTELLRICKKAIDRRNGKEAGLQETKKQRHF